MWLLLACAGGETGKEGLVGVAGTLTAERTGETTETVTADVTTLQAFGVNTNGRVALVLSPNTAATCDDAATFLTGPGEDWNPEIITGVGTCSVYVTGDYDGTALSLVDDPVAVTIALNCAMGDGEWVYEERGAGDVGYYYDGAWWIGSPEGFALDLSGGDTEPFELSLDMSTYTGSFTYDVAYPDPDPAAGEVSGTTQVTWCAAMGPALAR